MTRAVRDALPIGIDLIDGFVPKDLEAESGVEVLEAWIETFAAVFDTSVVARLAKWGKAGFNPTEREKLGVREVAVAEGCSGRCRSALPVPEARGSIRCR